MSEEIKLMKQTLMAAAQNQMGNLDRVNAKELGEVIDMIKDLEEAEYYCAITQAMEENKQEKKDSEKYYTPYMNYMDSRYNDVPGYPGGNKMWYGVGNTSGSSSNGGNMRGYTDTSYPPEMRDYREGKSPASRRGYIESKEMNQDHGTQLHKLEKYVNELSNDIVEMTANSTPEEKNLLHQKLAALANKIQ